MEFDDNGDGSGVITSIEERKNQLSRKFPKIKGSGRRGERLEQVIAANIDRLFIITSILDPGFNNRIVDRILVAGESSGIETVIIMNKEDLVEPDDDFVRYWKGVYQEAGYKIFTTSIVSDTGLDDLTSLISEGTNLFWGPSGVGKSSLLNILFPGLNFKTAEISNYSSKGKHTTVTSVLSDVGDNKFIVDTPGIREIDPYGLTEEDLCHYFREFIPFIHDCRFNTCTHNHEPGCRVAEAVEDGDISVERYESYLSMLETIEDELF